jgi:hypothetical protein
LPTEAETRHSANRRITRISGATKLPPRCGQQTDASRPELQAHCTNWEDRTVRKTLIALAAATGLIGLSSVGASAATVIPAPAADRLSAVQRADWDGCGPRCRYWQHRRWEAERHRWREHQWREYHRPYYGYNYYHGYYR